MPDSSIRPVLAPPVGRVLLWKAGESLPAGGHLAACLCAIASLGLNCLMAALPSSLSLPEGTMLDALCGCKPGLASTTDRMGTSLQGCLLAKSPARGLLWGVCASCELLRWSILGASPPFARPAARGSCLRLLLWLPASL